MSKRGFSLLETLIATGILVVVVLAVTSLSNSLIVGTISNADKTIINRWNAEGIELTKKIRDDNLLNKDTIKDPLANWFTPAIKTSSYGWYVLEVGDTSNTWKLTPVAGYTNKFGRIELIAGLIGEELTSDQTIGHRFICVEAVRAQVERKNDNFYCNTNDRLAPITSDGDRTKLSTCQTEDLYCAMTKESINRNTLATGKIIPPGNAVKIRSVIIWEDKGSFKSSSLATMITNWKGYEQ
ncbi:MAG: prepilin-type N-terminal cleavage/methylation domain-containing protein [Patescibacteria group bacterium]